MAFADLKNDLVFRRVFDEIQPAREYGAAQRAEGEAAGVAKGKAAAVLAVLAAREIRVSDETRARIEACTDVAMLDRWISRAATVSSIDEVFAAAS